MITALDTMKTLLVKSYIVIYCLNMRILSNLTVNPSFLPTFFLSSFLLQMFVVCRVCRETKRTALVAEKYDFACFC